MSSLPVPRRERRLGGPKEWDRRDCESPGPLEPSSQVAVATPGAMRRTVAALVRIVAEQSYENWCACYEHFENAYSLPPSGGRIGPLPDGNTILIEPLPWADLAEAVKWLDRGYVTEAEHAQVIVRFNERAAGNAEAVS
jgi:hypothetical protein